MNRELLFFASSLPEFVSKIVIFLILHFITALQLDSSMGLQNVQKVLLHINKYDMGFEAIRKLLHTSGDHTPKYL